ncbi:hypothetical protein AALB_2982 [Agarivorans albus MKT 106]|uniref:Uncharacterized protein n=1 Tax=Agarivorans albus MKT 106 TaxID=1331007 RepID=R9PNE0_AGAAL|nr:hypothetical protein AALB_2982 [Agarivorans albus MKT 106]
MLLIASKYCAKLAPFAKKTILKGETLKLDDAKFRLNANKRKI